jgi:uncharacterized protein (TIGR03437 family)
MWAETTFRITTVAGSNFVGDGGLATSATLNAAEGLATDAAGNLYIADSTGHRIRRVDRQGNITTIAGNGSAGFRGDGGPAAQAILSSPYGLAFDPAGNLLVADFGNKRIRRIGRDGVITTVAGGGTSRTPGEGGDALGIQFQGPRNLAVDSGGNLYISDYLDNRVYRIAASGPVSVVAGNAGELSYPAGLALDRSGNLFVADSGNRVIRQVSGGQVTTILGGSGSVVILGTPVGLTFDHQDNLYIADTSTNRLYRRALNGSVSTVAGANPTFDSGVRDATVDLLGTVYLSVAKQVWKLSSGAPVVVAGSGAEAKIVENSDALLTALQGPMGVATDNAGNLYIAEERLARVRRVTAGVVQTVAGGGSPVGASVGDGLPATEAKLLDPVAVAWDPVYGLRIFDYGGNRVRGVPAGGRIFTVAGDGEGGYRGDSGPAAQARVNRPRGAAFDREGNLYFADSLNHRIRKIGTNGFITTIAGSGVRGFFGDGGLAVQAQLNAPQGVAVDPLGNVFIADTGNNVIRQVSPEGVLSTVAGTGVRGYGGDGVPAASAALNSPGAVAVDADGLLLIADTFNHRIRRVTATGNIQTIAGDGTAGYSGDDGPANQAQLNAPTGLAVDAAGRIFVADFDNNRVRRLDPSESVVLPPGGVTEPGELAVMNAASLRTGPIAPGMILALFAAGITPARAAQAELTDGRLPFALGGYQVRIDGSPASLFYTGPGQINAEAPRGLTAKADALVEVVQAGKTIAAAHVEVRSAAPALFTMGQGVGQAVVVNQDGTLNSEERPAARGSIVTLFGTGDGETEPLGIDGVPSGNPPPRPIQAVQVQVGTAMGEVLFAGRAPGFVGLFQVNVQLPGVFTPPGVRALTVSVGRVTSQPGVTIVVK